jgi:hypothetical protein
VIDIVLCLLLFTTLCHFIIEPSLFQQRSLRKFLTVRDSLDLWLQDSIVTQETEVQIQSAAVSKEVNKYSTICVSFSIIYLYVCVHFSCSITLIICYSIAEGQNERSV